VVYIGSKDGNLYAINSSTGKGMWNYRTGNSILSSPAVNDEVVYVGSQDHNVYAINTNTGMKIWNYTLGGPVDSSPSIANNTIYVGSNWGAFDNVYALNISTGSKIWSFKTFNGEEKGVTSSPAVDDGRVFIGAQGGGLYALDASSGAQLWNRDEYFILHSSPAVAGGVVYINSDALNASTGETIWSFPTGNLVNASPVVSDGVVYIASQDGYFYAIGEHSHQPFFNIAIIIALVVIGVTITAVIILLYRRKKDT
jgi:outer membrane protein assembly factor BamB